MTEHVCKWKWDIVDNDAWFYCSGCKEPMGALEIEARLNATERLSAEVRALTHQDLENGVHEQIANAMGGNDER